MGIDNFLFSCRGVLKQVRIGLSCRLVRELIYRNACAFAKLIYVINPGIADELVALQIVITQAIELLFLPVEYVRTYEMILRYGRYLDVLYDCSGSWASL
jgi:hypothetical protein